MKSFGRNAALPGAPRALFGLALGVALLLGGAGWSQAVQADVDRRVNASGRDLVIVESGSGTPQGLTGELVAAGPEGWDASAVDDIQDAVLARQLDVVVRRSAVSSAPVDITVLAAGHQITSIVPTRLLGGRRLNRSSERWPVAMVGVDAANALGVRSVDRGVRIMIDDELFTLGAILRPVPGAPNLDGSIIIGSVAAERFLNASTIDTTAYVRGTRGSGAQLSERLGREDASATVRRPAADIGGWGARIGGLVSIAGLIVVVAGAAMTARLLAAKQSNLPGPIRSVPGLLLAGTVAGLLGAGVAAALAGVEPRLPLPMVAAVVVIAILLAVAADRGAPAERAETVERWRPWLGMAAAVAAIAGFSVIGSALGGDSDDPIPPPRAAFRTSELVDGANGTVMAPRSALLGIEDGRFMVDRVVPGERQPTERVLVRLDTAATSVGAGSDDLIEVLGWGLVPGVELIAP